jgi:hypothetical protein
MSHDSDPARDAIHDAIQAHAPIGQQAVLTGWALVAEWMDHDGERWLSRAHAASTPKWTAEGMWHEALHGSWPDDPQDPP